MNPIDRIVEFKAVKQGASFVWTEIRNTIGDVTPLTGTVATCAGGWIRAVNRTAPAMHGRDFKFDYKIAEKMVLGGKWIVQFSKNDPRILDIWKKVVDAVKTGIFCEAKVFVPNEKFDGQAILIYTANNEIKEDVAERLKRIRELKIIEDGVHIKYKTESATLQNKEEFKYTSEEFDKKSLFTRISNFILSKKRPIFAISLTISLIVGISKLFRSIYPFSKA